MADGPEKDNEDKVQDILADLDSILSIGDPLPGKSFDDVATGLGAAVPPPGNLPSKPPVPAKAPPGPQFPPKAGPPAPPPAAPPPVARPPAAAPPPPASAPPSADPTQPVPAAFGRRAADVGGEEELVDTVPTDAPKSQIRRIGYIYSAANRREMDLFLRSLDEVIGTVSKKPLFTRKVLLAAVDESTEASGMVSKLKGLKAVGVLAVVVNPKDPKIVELSKACEAAKIKFMIVPAPDVQKSAVLRDVAVDIMLRPSEM